MHTNLRSLLALSAALALAACGGDGGTGSGDATLTAAEIQALNRAMLGFTTDVGRGGAGGASLNRAPQQNTGTVSFQVDETAACESGGTARIVGDAQLAWDDVAETGSMGMDFAVTHAACGHPLDTGGVIRLTGDPDIDVTLDAEFAGQEATSMVVTEAGAFSWEKPGASGRCTLDVRAELVPGTQTVNVTGTFCGVDVSGSYTES